MPTQSHNIPYGSENLSFTIPAGIFLDTLNISHSPPLPDPDSALHQSLANPIGIPHHAFANFKPSDTIAIIISDSFRETRIDALLPGILRQLYDRGIKSQQIVNTYSTGTHRPPSKQENIRILGPEIAKEFQNRTFAHDPNDTQNLLHIGTTSRGTPVEINKRVEQSDRIILTGSVVLHYFGGFGGGRKSLVPGLASTKTIAHNHALNMHPTKDILDPHVRIGHTKNNPVAEDMLEATLLSHVDCIINTILNSNNEITQIFTGDLIKAHQAACACAYKTFTTPITQKTDLLIAASPSTKNFLQTHKALFNAYQAVKPQGRIIMLAPCTEGIGGEQFEKWLRLGDRTAIIAGLRKQSEINGQTALSTREKTPIMYIVTNMSPEQVALLGAEKADNLHCAIKAALADLARAGIPNPTYRIMPDAPYTVPVPAP
jgi:nickel-dependent lactate racemase